MDVHVRDLRYFVAVAEERHFTRAADRLYVSQPALSKQIRVLERHLRVALFHRDKRSVVLTAAGEALLPFAREVLATWAHGQQVMAEAEAAAGAILRVGFSTSVGRGVIPTVRRRFSEVRPGWSLDLRQVGWGDPSAGLADGSSDVAIVWLPVPVEGIDTLVVAEEPRWVALPTEHRLAGEETIMFSDLLDEAFLALPEEAGALRDYWLAVNERGGHPVRVGAVVTNADETFEAIVNGFGVALLSAGNAALYDRAGVIARPVEGVSGSRLVIAWRRDDHRPAIRDFVSAARTMELPGPQQPGRD